jgi:hypothetical protein
MDVEAIGQGALFVAGLVNYQLIPGFLPSTGNNARLDWALDLFGDRFAQKAGAPTRLYAGGRLDGFRL